ncbi:MAG TPA: hypothetical protein VGZ47_13070 [Gemmataceae bacterium]|jgi:hypothetical protein|nr:hypothetical protein [Gemmataceae bacterium]
MRKTVCYIGIAVVGLLVSAQTARADDPPAIKKFVNTKDGRTAKILENYIDFSFDYPAHWKIVEAGENTSNFVKVERSIGEGQDSLPQENFTVSNFSGSGNAEADKKLIPQFIAQLEEGFKKGFAKYKKTSEGATKFGAYKGTELRFTSKMEHPEKGPIQYWGRLVVIPNPRGGKKGAMVLLLATSLCPDLKEEKDLGVKGELPVIIKSFKFGK